MNGERSHGGGFREDAAWVAPTGLSPWSGQERDDAVLGLGGRGNRCGKACPKTAKTWSVSLDSVVKAHHPSYAIELDGTLV